MSDMYYEIVSSEVTKNQGEFEGRPWTNHTQEAYLYNDREVTKTTVKVDPQYPYKPGFYDIDSNAMITARNGKLSLSKLHVLKPRNEVAKKIA